MAPDQESKGDKAPKAAKAEAPESLLDEIVCGNANMEG